MKRFHHMLLAIVISAIAVQSTFAQDVTVTQDGVIYDIHEEEGYASVPFQLSRSNTPPTSVVLATEVTYNGRAYQVKVIDNQAFYCCSNITSITVPGSVETVGNLAFQHCDRLTSVTFCEGIKHIGSGIFYGGPKVETLVLPASLEEIGEAFLGAEQLKTVYILATTPPVYTDPINYSGGTFDISQCKLYVPKESLAAYQQADYWKDFTNNICAINPESQIIYYTTTDGGIVESIDPNVFGANIISITYEDGQGKIVFDGNVTTIGNYAFCCCSNLTSVTIPNSVTSIGESAFEECSSLTSVTIPNSVTSIGREAFAYCSNMTSVTIPNSVTSINAFWGCSSLKGILSLAVTPPSVGSDAFFGVNKETCVVKVPEESVEAYKSAEGWKEFTNNICAINPESQIIYYTTTDGNIIEPNNPNVFGANIISNTCENGQGKIVFDGDVTTIGEWAFRGCSSMTSVEIPNSVTEIGWSAFYDCFNLTSVGIPNSVTSIGTSAFSGCPSLTSVEIPNSVTSIGDWAFWECSSLTSVNIPNSVTSIGGGTFKGCSSLTSFTGKFSLNDHRCLIVDGVLKAVAPVGLTTYCIPNSVTSIEEWALASCTSLTSIEIPNSVTSIGNWAFWHCSSLKEITSLAVTPPSVGNGAFDGVNKETCILKVPEESVEAYKSAEGWKDFGSFEGLVISNNSLSIAAQDLRKGNVTMVPVMMDNEDKIVSFNCDIVLPEGLSLATDEYGDYAFEYSNRNDATHQLVASDSNGKVTVVGYSSKNRAYSGNSGELFYIPVIVDEDISEGTVLTIAVTNATLTKAETFDVIDVPNIAAEFTVVPSYTLGDVNNDGRFTAADISLAVEYVLGNSPANGIADAADANQDGRYTAADISIIVSYVLQQQ